MFNQKGFTPILILLVVVIMVGLSGGLYYFSKTNSPKPNATQVLAPSSSPTDETANWKTYTSKENGYSFKYPSAWRIAEPINSPVEIYSWPSNKHYDLVPDSEISIHIQFQDNPSKLTIEAWFQQDWGNERNKNNEQSILVNGIQAIRYTNKNLVRPLQYTSVSFVHGDKVYNISAKPPDSKYLQVFDTIISTFKFTDQQTLDTSNWKTYSNSDYSFKYPGDWHVGKQMQYDVVKSIDERISFDIHQVNSSAAVCGGGPGPQATLLKTIQVDDVSVELDVIRLPDAVTLILSHPVQKKSASYCIFFTFQNVEKDTEQNSHKILDQILATFKFTN